MSGKIPAGEFNTRISLDGAQPIQTMKSLKAEVSGLTNAWKAHEIQLKSAGDSLGAAKAKYEGLTQSVDKQKTVLERLKAEQSGIDQSTTKGAESYAKLGNQIESASRKLASMEAQQKRAKMSMDYYQTGIADAKEELKKITDVSKSYVDCLAAEDRQVASNVAKLNGLRTAYNQMTVLYDKQVTELKNIEVQSGKTSAEYAKQEVRVNELGAKLATTRKAYEGLDKSVGGLSPRLVDLSDKITGQNTKLTRYSERLTEAGRSMQTMSTVSAVALGAAVKVAADVQDKYITTTNLLVQGGEKTAKATRNTTRMQQDATQYAQTYGESLKNIAMGYQELVKRGYDSNQSLGSMEALLQASRASGDNFKDVLQVTAGTLEGFGLRVDETTGKVANTEQMIARTKKVVNELAYGADVSATDFSSIGVAMEYVSGTAHSSNMSLSQTTALLGVLSNNALEGDKAGTGLRKVINSLTAASDANSASTEKRTTKIQEQIEKLKEQATHEQGNTKRLAATNAKIERLTQDLKDQQESAEGAGGALGELGMTTDDLIDKTGKLKPLSTIFKTINDHMDALGKSDAERTNIFTKLFGTTGQQAGIILSQNVDQIDRYDKKISESVKNDYVGKLSKKNMASAKNQLKIFKEQGEVLGNEVGQVILPYLTELLKGTSKFVKSFDRLPDGAKKFVVFGTVATAALSPLLILMGKVAGALVSINTAGGKLVRTMGRARSKNRLTDAVQDVGDLASGGTTAQAPRATANTTPISTGATIATQTSRRASTATKFLKGAAALDVGVNIVGAGTDIVGAIKAKNPDEKFKQYGKATGTTLGTAIGFAVGGPIGAAIGGVVGKEVGPLGGKAAKNWIKGWNDYGTKHKPKNFVEKLGSGTHKVTKSVGDSYSKSLQAETAQKMAQAGVSSKQTKAKSNDPYAGLSKSVKKLLKDSNTSFNGITSGFIKMNNTTAKESAKAEKTEESSYKKLTTSLSKYYKDKEGKSKKDLQTLVKNGSITQKQANADLKKQKANDKQKQKVITDSYKAIQKLETKYGTQRKKLSDKLNSQETAALKKTKTANQKILDQYEKKYGKDSSKYQKEKEKLDKQYNAQKAKLDQSNNKKLEKQHATYLTNISKAEQKANATLEKNLDTSSNKQKKILEKLSNDKQKLSHDQMISVIKDSQKERDQQIDDAQKAYDGVVKNANKQYKESLDAAKKKRDDVIAAAKYEHDTAKTMSDDQYNKIVNNAKSTYKESVTQAKNKKTDTVAAAKTEKEQTTTKAKEMHKNVVDEATKQAKEHKDAVVDEKGNVVTQWGKMRDSMAGIFNNVVDSMVAMIKGMGMTGVAIPRWKKYATGSSGTLEDEIAVVGEEGFELAHTPGKGIYPLGVKGQETRFVPKGTSILPHEQSKQFLAMTSQLPHHALGIPGQITDWFGDVLGKGKELASDLGGMIEKGATWVLGRIEDKIGLKAFVDSFNNVKGTAKYGLAHGSRNTVLTQAAKYLQEFFNKWMAEHAGGSGSRGEFLKNAIKFSKGKPYVWGAAGPDSFDCSGLVMYTLAKMGVDFPHFSGSQFNKTKAVAEKDAKVGDLSFYGSGGSEHVGIVSDPHKKKMWAAQSPSNNPNIGYDDIHNGLPFAGIRRVTQLHDEGAGGDYADTIREAAEIMKQKVTDFNVDMISRIIKNESGGNPKAINLWDSNAIAGHPSKGILQFIQPTFDHYKMAGHGDIYNPLDQLIALFNDSTWRSDMGMGYNGKYGEWRGNASGPSGSPIHPNHQFANGGLATEASIFGEAGPEMAIPMSAVKSSRGYELLGKTAAAFAARDTVNGDSDSEVVTTLKNIETLLTMVLGQDNDDLTGQAQITVENPINLDGKKLANGITNKYVLPKITDALKKGRQKLSGV